MSHRYFSKFIYNFVTANNIEQTTMMLGKDDDDDDDKNEHHRNTAMTSSVFVKHCVRSNPSRSIKVCSQAYQSFLPALQTPASLVQNDQVCHHTQKRHQVQYLTADLDCSNFALQRNHGPVATGEACAGNRCACFCTCQLCALTVGAALVATKSMSSGAAAVTTNSTGIL